MLIIGIGLGFFIASCLMFYVMASVTRENTAQKKARQEIDRVILLQQKQIAIATERIADALKKK